MNQLITIQHALAQDSLGYLRSTKTSIEQFRFHSDRLTSLLLSHALSTIHLDQKTITTPLTLTVVDRISEEIVVIPILRAGLTMLPGVLSLIPTVKVGFVGLERDEESAIARNYYCKLPTINKNTVVLITDPMLATGGSLIHVLNQLSTTQNKRIIVVSVIAAPEGIKAVQDVFPQVTLITASIDSHLDEKKYIVPGLGDYGDRYFGT